MINLKAKDIEIIKLEAKIFIDIKMQYFGVFDNLILTQFIDLIYTFQTTHHNYKNCIIAKYYEVLGIGYLYNKFINIFFKKYK